MLAATLALAGLHLLPHPSAISAIACPGGRIGVPATVARGIDDGAYDELAERWNGLRIGVPVRSAHPGIRFATDAQLGPQAYRLRVDRGGVVITSADADGAFYGAMTLAQLPQRDGEQWVLPCVQIDDAPALRWRVLSDDVSRGPLPTMRYFEERIRTIAAFKFNGYSPYMEHVFVTPSDPLPAPLEGITPAQLAQLARYAARFHVALIPEQQTFAHMHGVLRVEQYAPAAEFPHGFLLSPESGVAASYLQNTIAAELAAVPHPPFFHIGSDETATLGEGATTQYVADNGGRSAVYAGHVDAMARLIAPSGARVMLWDDGIEGDPSIMTHLPKNAVIVNWHYDARASYQPFIDTIVRGGFEQMVAPGANNWNELFPDLTAALPNEARFIDEGKRSHVLGLFQTVWHDDGETLYETTWYPVLFAGAAAWGDIDADSFARDFPAAFFGSDDARYASDETTLGGLDARLGGSTDKLFWADPFDVAMSQRLSDGDLSETRLSAERVETHLLASYPPLHVGAAAAMLLAARRFDALGRRYQIAREVRDYYAAAATRGTDALRELFWCKYWFWEQRDSDEMLAPLYADAWRYESRDGHLASNLERYHLDAQHAIERADAIDRVTYEDYVPDKALPNLDDVLR